MQLLLRHIELLVSILGVLVIVLIPWLLTPESTVFWKGTAIIAALVGLLHGLMIWAVRHRQRQLRRRTIFEMQRMLQDRMNNQLTVVMMNAALAKPLTDTDAERLRVVQSAAEKLAGYLDSLSEEALTEWQAKYDPKPPPIK